MLPMLLDGAMPGPIFLFLWLYETNPLLPVLLLVGFLLITMGTIIIFSSRERKEDKRNRDKHNQNKQ